MLSLALAPRGLSAAEMRVRLAWGGGGERLWSGTISLSPEGTVAHSRPLGIEAEGHAIEFRNLRVKRIVPNK